MPTSILCHVPSLDVYYPSLLIMNDYFNIIYISLSESLHRLTKLQLVEIFEILYLKLKLLRRTWHINVFYRKFSKESKYQITSERVTWDKCCACRSRNLKPILRVLKIHPSIKNALCRLHIGRGMVTDIVQKLV